MKNRRVAMVRDLTPPVVWRGIKCVLRRVGLCRPQIHQERDKAWYDIAFKERESYSYPYQKSPYYFLWCVVVDRIMQSGTESVLDIGCGPGQVARFLCDKGLKNYIGLDLSSVATSMAKALCPEYDFVTASAFDTDVFETVRYDTVISMEFLEHVSDDISVLNQIAKGTRFIGTVPNYESLSHVRHFASCEEVARRYRGLFKPISVEAFDLPSGDHRFFLIDGIRA